MIILIAAAARNNALGKDNRMVWHLPDDFKRFKQLTSGHHIIMGRKTFESLPGMLSNRTHIVITRSRDYSPEGVLVAHSLEAALALVPDEQDTFVIGGGEIYKLALPLAQRVELTRVETEAEADAFFPELGPEWQLTQSNFHPADEKHAFAFTFETYEKA